MADLNLLPVEEKSAERFGLISKRLMITSIVLLIFTAISALATLLFFASVATTRQKLIEQVEQASRKINDFKSTEELIVVTKQKASISDKILTDRLNHLTTFETLSVIIPQGVYFSDLKISQGKIAVSGKARTSADVAGLVAALLSPRGAEIVSDVTIDNLSSDESQAYSFNISARILAKKT